ncbi:WD40 repeat domain-containing serine/threonine protein kinase [Saccharothrix luteola]|uniref:WD40 repeat domain-containing serine/threonine protein kinase n=1 Tax=Saccharothrix luteola TaxID=2893018 RepID=UPI001E3BDC76|nr:serine/threonine-protein kinase [Saccharothrix luteola]MCC8242954.1 serine/threonine protein kinase [Saccharothrix luteola]
MAPPHHAPEPGDPAAVGTYQVEGVLGEGGMGRVYLGRTPAGGAVAVKVVHREFAADGGFRARFEREVATARQVHGLYTVPVVDADPRAERPWLASAYVAGPSLQHTVTEHGPGSTATVLRLVAAVAEGLQSLHAAGVVHRDLRPSNVLLVAGGLRLSDYGIANAVEGTSVTRAGAPAYLAPEYIRGDEVTGAADVFALGLVAYFAATGRLAFGGGHAHAMTYRIVEQEPDLEGCPEPLRDLVVDCLRKDPRQRPAPAEIVERCRVTAHGDGHASPPPAVQPAVQPPVQPVVQPGVQPIEPTVTRPVIPPGPPPPPHLPGASGPQGLTRRQLLLGAGGVVGVAGLGIAIAALWPDDSDHGDVPPVVTGPFRLAGTFTDHTASVNNVAFSPDGLLLAGMSGEDIRFWDVAGHEQRAVLTGQARPTFGMAFSPDGRLLATADDRTVRLWDVESREARAALSGHTGEIGDIAFSPDGRLLASAGEDKTVRLWDVASGGERAVLTGHGTNVPSVSFHPGGRLLASCSGESVFLWDVPEGRLRDVLDVHKGNVWAVAFSPDGAVLAASDTGTGSAGGRVVFWDVEVVGQQNAVLGGNEKPIRDLAFSPDGRLLATAAEELKVWDVAGGGLLAVLDGHDLGVNDVAFSSTGLLASAGLDARVLLWERV